MFEKVLILDPGAFSFRLFDPKKNRVCSVRTCYIEENGKAVTGKKAFEAYWTGEGKEIRYPVSQGHVTGRIEPLLAELFREAEIDSFALRPSLKVIVPDDITEQEKEEWKQIGLKHCLRKVSFVRSLDLLKKENSMVVHAGHSCTEIAVWKGNRLAAHQKIIFGAGQIDEGIIQMIQHKWKCLLFPEDASVLRTAASRAFWARRNPLLSCTVYDYTGQYVRISFPASDLWPAFQSVFGQIAMWASSLVARTGVETMESVLANPVHLSGGLAGCYGLVQTLQDALKAKVIAHSDLENVLLERAVSMPGKP